MEMLCGSAGVVTLLTFAPEPDPCEAALEALLPAATRERLQAYKHPARRRQTLWGRLLALAAAKSRGAVLTEEPPYPPFLMKDGHRTELSVAHTGLAVALGCACTDDPLMGLDLETVRTVRSVSAIARMSLGTAADRVVTACEAADSTDPFFYAWGLHEACVKLNRGGARWHLAPGAGQTAAVVMNNAGQILHATHRAEGNLRLTVLTAHSTPQIRLITAAALRDVLMH